MRDKLIKRAVESLLEDERLRSQLTDTEAAPLVAWAEARVVEMVNRATSTQDTETAQAQMEGYLRQIRRVMREINDLTGDRDNIDDVELRKGLADLAALLGQKPQDQEIEQIVARRKGLSGEDFVVRLIKLVSPGPEANPGGPRS